MRHAQSPPTGAGRLHSEQRYVGFERELDDVGKAIAIAMGEALRGLLIRVGKVYSSPTFRAIQTAQLAQLPAPEAEAALGDRLGAEEAAWIRNAASELPVAGTNTVLITRAPNVMAAFDEQGLGMSDGEMLIVRPGGGGKLCSCGKDPHATMAGASRCWRAGRAYAIVAGAAADSGCFAACDAAMEEYLGGRGHSRGINGPGFMAVAMGLGR